MAFHVDLSNVLICEDHYVSACGMEVLLRKYSPVPLKVRMAHTGRDALELVRQESPQLAVIDLELPDISGLEVIKGIREQCPSARILVITAHNEPHLIRKTVQLKADALIRKTDTDQNIRAALKALSGRRRELYMDPQMRSILDETTNKALTRREYEVVEHMARGLTSGEIAAKMDCSVTTVKTYRARIMGKSGCRNSAEIMAWYLKGNGKRNPGALT